MEILLDKYKDIIMRSNLVEELEALKDLMPVLEHDNSNFNSAHPSRMEGVEEDDEEGKEDNWSLIIIYY